MTIFLKGTLTGFELEIKNFIFPILMFRMVNMVTFNAFSKFESQILSYKQDTEFGVLCFVKKKKSLRLIIVFYWYRIQPNVAFFC